MARPIRRSASSDHVDVGALVRKTVRSLAHRIVTPSAHLAAVETANNAWVRRFELLETERQWQAHDDIKSGGLAAHAYPEAPFEIIELAANTISLLFLWDDRYGEGIDGVDLAAMDRLFQSYVDVMRSGRVPERDCPFYWAFLDLRNRFLEYGSEAWVQRFSGSLRLYFDGCLLDLPYRASRESPTLRFYRLTRRWSIGVHPMLDLIELATGDSLTDEVFDRPEIRRMRDLTTTLCAWDNDFYSFGKESVAGDPLNLVTVIMREKNVPVSEAFSAAKDIYNEDLTELYRMMAEFSRRPDFSAVERSYLAGLEQWVNGLYTWQPSSIRYHRKRLRDPRSWLPRSRPRRAHS